MRWAFLLPFEQSFNSFPGRIFLRHQTTPQSPSPTPTPRRSRHQQYGPCSTSNAVASRCRCGAHCVINKDCAPREFVQTISKEYHRLKLRQRPASPVPGVPSLSLDNSAGASCDTARQLKYSVSQPSVRPEATSGSYRTSASLPLTERDANRSSMGSTASLGSIMSPLTRTSTDTVALSSSPTFRLLPGSPSTRAASLQSCHILNRSRLQGRDLKALQSSPPRQPTFAPPSPVGLRHVPHLPPRPPRSGMPGWRVHTRLPSSLPTRRPPAFLHHQGDPQSHLHPPHLLWRGSLTCHLHACIHTCCSAAQLLAGSARWVTLNTTRPRVISESSDRGYGRGRG